MQSLDTQFEDADCRHERRLDRHFDDLKDLINSGFNQSNEILRRIEELAPEPHAGHRYRDAVDEEALTEAKK